MKTVLLAVAFVAVSPPAFGYKIQCDRGYEKAEVFFVNLDDKNEKSIQVELHGRHETINQIKAGKTFPIYSVTGKVSDTGNRATISKLALDQQLPPDNERSWTVYFGDHGQNSLVMSLTSYNYGELTYVWKGQLNMQPGVKEVCFFADR